QTNSGGYSYGPVHRPMSMSAAGVAAPGYTAGPQPLYGGAAGPNMPPPPPQQQQQQPYQYQQMTGRGVPGHKQPRSRDRMRSTLHYDNFSMASLNAAMSAPNEPAAHVSLQPQHPVDMQSNVGPAPNHYQPPPPQQQQQQQLNNQTAQATGAVPSSSRYYAGQPLSAAQARNMQRQQQQPPLQSQQQPISASAGANMYGTQHAGIPPGAAAVGGPTNGYYIH
ncbi:hypothetical protein H4R20_003588, partial [Coemansia guatemalensis]